MREMPIQPPSAKLADGTVRAYLNSALFDLNCARGRRTNATIMALVVASVIAAMVATLPGLPTRARSAVESFEFAISIVFMGEYLLRIAVAKRPLRYTLGFYGVVDLLTWLPLLLGQGSAALRLLRIVRLLKLLRYMGALRLFLASMRDAAELVLVVIGAICVIAIIAGNLIHLTEPETFTNAFVGAWWALVTMTTVGYGDLVPHSVSGMVIAALLMMTGIVMFAMLTGTISIKIANLIQQDAECPACATRTRSSHQYCPHCGVLQSEKESTVEIDRNE